MRKYIYAVSILGLFSAGAIAASSIDLSGLPDEVREKVEEAQKKAESQENPVQAYVKQSKDLAQKYMGESKAFLEKYPYLKGNKVAEGMIGLIEQYSKDIVTPLDALSEKGIPEATTTQTDLAGMESMYVQLQDQTYPQVCKTYEGESVKGWVKLKLGSRTEYGFYADDNNQSKFTNFIGQDDVGHIGTGKEYVLSMAKNSEVEAKLGDDGKGNKVVVCIGKFIKKDSKEK